MIDSDFRTRVESSLRQIEAEEAVRILYACESGSRAWGFPSQDSDYDVRFIYRHELEWYLSVDVETKRDVIECPVTGHIDISGWDLRKALKLMAKSNPPLLEWIRSPIVYLDPVGFGSRLRAISDRYYSPRACAFHYLHMARGNVREYLRGDTVWLKKYFYVLRPLLAIRWIESGCGQVPMEFDVLVEVGVKDKPLKSAIGRLLQRKIAGEELDRGPRIAEISDFIDQEMSRHDATPHWEPGEPANESEIDCFFREELNAK